MDPSNMIENPLRMCRVCTANEGDGELLPIFEKNNKIAISIFLISQVKVNVFSSKDLQVS